MLIDTDVLIDYLRDYPDAVSYVEAQQERLLLSVVTVAELYVACVKARNGHVWSVSCGRLKLSLSIYAWWSKAVSIAVTIVRVTMEGWQMPSSLRRRPKRQVSLVTLNRRHFPMLQDVIVPYRKP